MDFFKTDDGLLHVGRIAGIFYLIALVGGCLLLDEFDRLCAARTVSTAGWWMALGGKRPPRTWFEAVGSALPMTGTIVAVLGITGQFYFTWAGHHSHL